MHSHAHVEIDRLLWVDVRSLQVHVAADDNTCDVGIQHVPVLAGMAVVLQAVVAPKSSRPNQDQHDPQCARIYVVEPVAVQNVALVLASSQVVSDADCQTASFPVDFDGSRNQASAGKHVPMTRVVHETLVGTLLLLWIAKLELAVEQFVLVTHLEQCVIWSDLEG